MARLNARPSAARGSRVGSPAPTCTDASDQENREPGAGPRTKGKAPAMESSSRRNLPTPSTEGSDGPRGQKRKRVGPRLGATQPDDVPEDHEPDEERFTRYFDPNQNPEQRRQAKRASRALERQFNENRDDYLHGDDKGLTDTIHRANVVYKNVKQTGDATLDSRLFINISNVGYQKAQQLALGDTSTGVDVEEFLNKCISYMRHDGPVAASQDALARPQRQTRGEEDSDDEDDDVVGQLNWDVLGTHACFPYNSRPACPSFLLGPLSVEKKQRKQSQRTARLKDTNTREMRPEAITKEDMGQSDQDALTAICERIQIHLNRHVKKAKESMDREFSSAEEMNSARGKAWLKKHRITLMGGPSLFDYVLNPHSFGQTVENIFYISFLLKEGHAGIVSDENGLPVVVPAEPTDPEDRQKGIVTTVKSQAVFSLDYGTWQKLVEAFDVREPMIKHSVQFVYMFLFHDPLTTGGFEAAEELEMGYHFP